MKRALLSIFVYLSFALSGFAFAGEIGVDDLYACGYPAYSIATESDDIDVTDGTALLAASNMVTDHVMSSDAEAIDNGANTMTCAGGCHSKPEVGWRYRSI